VTLKVAYSFANIFITKMVIMTLINAASRVHVRI